MNLDALIARRMSRVVHDRSEMRPYQTDELLPLLRENPFFLGAVDMGLGKTVTILTLIEELVSAGKVHRVLVIGPVRVIVQTWPTEIAEWSHTWWMKHTILRPRDDHPELKMIEERIRAEVRASDEIRSWKMETQTARAAHKEKQFHDLCQTKTPIHLINKEATAKLVEYWRGQKYWPYDYVVVDESRDFANYKAGRWQALKDVLPAIKRMHLLSGVPAPEGIIDYFSQIFMLDKGQRLGNNITAFRTRYMRRGRTQWSWEPMPGASEEVAEQIADICVVMKEEDYLPRDKPFEITRKVRLTKEEMKVYRKFQREFVIETPEGEEIEALNAASLAQKLMQLASGTVYDSKHKWHVFHEQKIEEMKQIREELPDEPLMIAYWHRSSLARLKKLFPKSTVMDGDGKCVAAWNAGKIRELLVHPRSTGHGLNMQYGPGHILVFFDNPLPLDPYLQLRKRMDRSGQKAICKIIHLVTIGTIDEKVVPVLQAKNDAQTAIRNHIRNLRRRFDG